MLAASVLLTSLSPAATARILRPASLTRRWRRARARSSRLPILPGKNARADKARYEPRLISIYLYDIHVIHVSDLIVLVGRALSQCYGMLNHRRTQQSNTSGAMVLVTGQGRHLPARAPQDRLEDRDRPSSYRGIHHGFARRAHPPRRRRLRGRPSRPQRHDRQAPCPRRPLRQRRRRHRRGGHCPRAGTAAGDPRRRPQRPRPRHLRRRVGAGPGPDGRHPDRPSAPHRLRRGRLHARRGRYDRRRLPSTS